MGIILKETAWKQVRRAKYNVALLPWGATEAHNYHLPYGTDIYEAEDVAAESARIAASSGAHPVVLPCIPFGVNTGQADIPLCINMNPSTQFSLLKDVAESVHRSGIRKLVILNSHGGNDFKQMIREFQLTHPSLFLCQINWWQTVGQKEFFANGDDHAGEMETSVMLHLHADVVLPLTEAGPGKQKNFKLKGLKEKWVWAPRQWTKVSKDTGVGDPSKGTAKKGMLYFDAVCKKIAGFLLELDKANLNDLYEKK